jgi:hypothetical protein
MNPDVLAASFGYSAHYGPPCQTLTVEPNTLLHVCDDDGRLLLVAAEERWGRPVPHCPEWDAAELVRHTGSVLQWMATIVSSGERVSRRSLPPGPENLEDLPAWYLATLARTLDVLGSTDPDSETWTFSTAGEQRVRWWCRRVAVEVATEVLLPAPSTEMSLPKGSRSSCRNSCPAC